MKVVKKQVYKQVFGESWNLVFKEIEVPVWGIIRVEILYKVLEQVWEEAWELIRWEL